MFQLSRRIVRRHRSLYVGSFVALAVGVFLLGLAATATAATIAYDGAPGDSITVTVTGADDGPHQVRVPITNADVAGLQTVLSIVAGISAFITIFVIASTFAFAVASRRRELGLLRLIGATPRQIRRLVLGEALVVAVVAAVTGAALAQLATPLLLAKASYTELAPVKLEPASPWVALAIAAGVGLVVAMLGARSAARRAGRVGPIDALREAALEPPRIGPVRIVIGVIFLAGCLTLLALIRPGTGEAVIPLAMFTPMLLVVALTLLAPLVVPWLGRLLAVPLVAWTRASGRLARSNVVAAPRRSASLAAPILAISAIAGSMVLTLSFAADASAAAVMDGLRAPIVVTSDGSGSEGSSGDGSGDGSGDASGGGSGSGSGSDSGDLRERIVATPGVAVADGALPLGVIRTDRDDAELDQAEGIDPAVAARTRKLPEVSGRLADLTGDSVALGKDFAGMEGYHLGDQLQVTFTDRSTASLRVVAILRSSPDLNAGMLVPAALAARHQPDGRPSRWFVLPEAGTDSGALIAALNQRLAGTGATAVPAADWRQDQDKALRDGNQIGLMMLLGPAGLYSAIAIANTLLMGSLQRRHEFVTSRLLGATPAQLRRMVLWESSLVGLTALTLGTVITVTVGLLLRHAMTAGLPDVPTTVPWLMLLGIGLGCLLLAVGAALAPTAFILRHSHPSTPLQN